MRAYNQDPLLYAAPWNAFPSIYSVIVMNMRHDVPFALRRTWKKTASCRR